MWACRNEGLSQMVVVRLSRKKNPKKTMQGKTKWIDACHFSVGEIVIMSAVYDSLS